MTPKESFIYTKKRKRNLSDIIKVNKIFFFFLYFNFSKEWLPKVKRLSIVSMVFFFLLLLLFSSQLCSTLCDLMDCSTLGLPVTHHLLEFAQVHGHCMDDTILLSHLLTPSSPSALSLSQHQGLFQWVGCSNQVAKILKLRLQHQPSQRVFVVDFL